MVSPHALNLEDYQMCMQKDDRCGSATVALCKQEDRQHESDSL